LTCLLSCDKQQLRCTKSAELLVWWLLSLRNKHAVPQAVGARLQPGGGAQGARGPPPHLRRPDRAPSQDAGPCGRGRAVVGHAIPAAPPARSKCCEQVVGGARSERGRRTSADAALVPFVGAAHGARHLPLPLTASSSAERQHIHARVCVHQ